jgi:hypothetical protein
MFDKPAENLASDATSPSSDSDNCTEVQRQEQNKSEPDKPNEPHHDSQEYTQTPTSRAEAFEQLRNIIPSLAPPPADLIDLMDRASKNADDRCMLARSLIEHCSIIPIKDDGSKMSPIRWKRCQERRATQSEVFTWWGANSQNGIGVICGLISQNFIALDFEEWLTFISWSRKVAAWKESVFEGCLLVLTPGGGAHMSIRLPEAPPPGKKLAYKWDERKHDWGTLIETRGTGNYVLAPGSPATCHETKKPYLLFAGDPLNLRVLPQEDFDRLIECCREYDEKNKRGGGRSRSIQHEVNADNATKAMTWNDILLPHQFKLENEEAGVQYWQKPHSSNSGHHVTTNFKGDQQLRCFSTSCPPFETGRSYSQLEAYRLLNHCGSNMEAQDQLASIGRHFIARSRRFDDIGNAERFVEQYGDTVRWVEEFKCWYVWDGRRWKESDGNTVLGFAKRVARSIFNEVAK